MSAPFEVDPADAGPGEVRLAEASLRFEGTTVTDPRSTAFGEAFAVLWDYFGWKNEMEARPAIERWLADPLEQGPIRIGYHLLTWRDRATGALAGVRDGFVGVDLERGHGVALMSHSFILPAFRRSGLSALIRTAPATPVRHELAHRGLEGAPILLLAEMDPVDPANEATIVRLLSYGRAGFGAIPPEVVPYRQPDFRELAPGGPAEPIPLLLVGRRVGRESERRVPVDLLRAAIEHLALLHARACEPVHLEELAASDRQRLAALQDPELPLIPLPTSPSELGLLEPLLRSRVFPHYPERYRRDLPDPDAERAALEVAARRMASRADRQA